MVIDRKTGSIYVSKLSGLSLMNSVQLVGGEGEGGELVINFTAVMLFSLSEMFIKGLRFFPVTY